jgi:protein-S-isoprenylcysteine O-methyltransferase Ste14
VDKKSVRDYMKAPLRFVEDIPVFLFYLVLFAAIIWIRSAKGGEGLNIPSILLFVVLIVVPYSLEQLAYYRFTGNKKAVEHRRMAKVVRGYGVAYLWDAAHFFVFLAAGFRLVGPEQPFSTWEWFGYNLFLVGVAMRIWALRELGIHYDSQISIHPQHQVVTTGPYRLMRHPLHFGSTAQVLGLAFLAPIWVGLPATIMAMVATLYLGHLEDHALRQNLGKNFEGYYLRTWDMIDLIFRKHPPQQ